MSRPPAWPSRNGTVQVIAHRGASARLPEHTLAAYARAIDEGADLIEPDLVMTGDGVLVARHESRIDQTTDVAARPEFAHRRRRRRIEDETVEGWFSDDFSLAELRTLRARERLPQLRGTAHDGRFAVPSLAEIITLVSAAARTRGRPIGLIPELKHSTHFRALGLPMEDALLAALAAHPYTAAAPVTIQSFEIANLRYLRQRLGSARGNVRLLQLLDDPAAQPYDQRVAGGALRYADLATPQGLRAVAGYADAIGPPIRTIMPLDAHGRLGSPTALVADAHAAGLDVLAYTFRPENRFLAAEFRHGEPHERHEAGSIAEIRAYLAQGIDGFFTDDSALGRRAVDAG